MSTTLRKSSSQAGFTLVEFALVIGLFTVVTLGVLAAYTHVTESERQRQLYSEISYVRKAVSTWASDGLLYYDGSGVCSNAAHTTQSACTTGGGTWSNNPGDLLNFGQIRASLPHPLESKATTGVTTLADINPYGGDYVFVPATATEPRKWQLQVTNLPDGLQTLLDKNFSYQAKISMAWSSGTATFTIEE